MQIIGNKLIIIMQHYIFIETIQVGMSIIALAISQYDMYHDMFMPYTMCHDIIVNY